MTELDIIDRRLLNLVQREFPLLSRPYAHLGLMLGIDENEVIERLRGFKTNSLVRQIGPVLDARRLGFQSTLVAMRIASCHLERAEGVIAAHPGVSHGYERENRFNVWFTLSIKSAADMDKELARMTREFPVEAVISLPALKVFKLDVYFDMTGNGERNGGAGNHSAGLPQETVDLSRLERDVINELQQDLPLVAEPFSRLSARLGMEVTDFLACCRSLAERSIMRRFGASVAHRKAGFRANGMACWIASPAVVDASGARLAELKEVSHCYERKTDALWPYNLFAMVHGTSREGCMAVVDRVSADTGLTGPLVLFSTREFKKSRIRYQV